MNFEEQIKEMFPNYGTRGEIYDSYGANLTPQVVHSEPEYTVIDETEETVFVQDENGAPHVFTREEWAQMQGTGGAGLLAVVAIAAAGLLLL